MNIKSWGWMRIIRLVLGIIIVIQGIMMKEWLYMILGGFFTLFALMNVGCCGTSCTVPRNSGNSSKPVTYEEIK
ncbi:MAG TPA: hypothetical protein PKY29_05225 [Ferruginibacter sp.]|nr:hypothetical protein [Ferruginibacter sp.]HRO17547.1 hypothetical protein [Ferruginibacter sp.]HRQ20694.1 hypothetical protein [Ferruginibacter sp.]